MTTQQKIFLIEDDFGLADPLKFFFEGNGFSVIHTGDGAFAIPLYEKENPDIILLDIELPNKNGYEIISEIRKKDVVTPVIFITGTELTDESITKGYALGAFNYFRKPIIPQMLLELIKNLLQVSNGAKKYSLAGYEIILHSQHLQINNNTLILREKEAAILKLLLEKMKTPVKREDIIERVWKGLPFSLDNTLDVSVSRLKKALSSFPHIRIKSIYGVGYMLTDK